MPNDVVFVATYDDGSEEWFRIEADILRGDDRNAERIAREYQQTGWLPPGNIRNVKRQTS